MAIINEDEQDRQTYGNPSGFQSNETTREPVSAPPAQSSDVPSDSSPEGEGAATPAAEEDASQDQPSEQATPQQSQAEPSDVPFNQHPRWIERQREMENLRAQNQVLTQTLQRVGTGQQPVQAPAAPDPDPWEGLTNHQDPQTALFYQQQKRLIDHAVQRGRNEAIKELSPVLDTITKTTASMSLKEFRKDNPDIQPGSEEEGAVIAYMEGRVDGMKHSLESARNNAVIQRMETELKTLKSRQAQTPQKRQATHVERGSGIPQTNGLPGRPATATDRAKTVIRKGGTYKDVAAAFFGFGGSKPQVES